MKETHPFGVIPPPVRTLLDAIAEDAARLGSFWVPSEALADALGHPLESNEGQRALMEFVHRRQLTHSDRDGGVVFKAMRR